MAKWFIGPNRVSDKQMTALDAAYMAGFLDGEGTIGLYKCYRKEAKFGYRYQPMVTLSNTNVAVLEYLQEACGNGRLIQQTNPAHPGHKDGYALRWSSNQIRHMLPQLLPYLRIKRRQAEFVLSYLSKATQGKKYAQERLDEVEGLYLEMQALNRKGVTVQ